MGCARGAVNREQRTDDRRWILYLPYGQKGSEICFVGFYPQPPDISSGGASALRLSSEKGKVINMPGGNGTGPTGMGPMTGRAAGYCAGYPAPGYANPIPGRGYGLGFGRGWGRGRGFGRGFGWYGAVYPYASNVAPQQEADMLREQAKAMQEEVKAVNERITELESAAKKTK